LLYLHLAEYAARVLVPGGLCLAYVGSVYLPEALDQMREHLKFLSTIALVHGGPPALRFDLHMKSCWKPILLFGKPPIRPWWTEWPKDVIQGAGREKSCHEWQQGLAEVMELVERFTPPGGLVCTPFAGSGTVAIAADRLGRPFVAIEKDKDTADRARRRLAAGRKARDPARPRRKRPERSSND
jgi:hypothetical protein